MQGARDNGLRAGNYVHVSELDPRVADDVLLTLRDHGIAAYVRPAEGTVGGAMETRIPVRGGGAGGWVGGAALPGAPEGAVVRRPQPWRRPPPTGRRAAGPAGIGK